MRSRMVIGGIVVLLLSILFSLNSFGLLVEQCTGCIVEENCVLPGIVRLGSYCDPVTHNMTLLSDNPDDCEYDYQCLSKNCVSGTCKKINVFEAMMISYGASVDAATNRDNGVILIDGVNSTYLEDIPKEVRPGDCFGCYLAGTCVPVGWRQRSQYCSVSGLFKKERAEDDYCTWGYQCSSGKCFNSKCTKVGGFKAFYQWLDKWF